MMYGLGMWGSDGFPFGEPMMFPLVLFLFWSLFWKGLALWHAAVRKQSWWFIALLVINTGGLLEIIYLFAIAKVKGKDLFR